MRRHARRHGLYDWVVYEEGWQGQELLVVKMGWIFAHGRPLSLIVLIYSCILPWNTLIVKHDSALADKMKASEQGSYTHLVSQSFFLQVLAWTLLQYLTLPGYHPVPQLHSGALLAGWFLFSKPPNLECHLAHR